jgi:hypothetical protein
MVKVCITPRTLVALAGVLILAACSATSSPTIGTTSTPPEEPTTTSLREEPGGVGVDPTTTATASTTTTEAGAASPFSGVDVPVISPRGFGWNDNFVIPGPVIVHDGIQYMFYTGHTYARPNLERGQVGVATSVDGSDWAFTDADPLFDGSEYAWTEGGVYPTSGLVTEDGTWVLWFSAIPRAFSTRALVIGRATAPDPDGPWTVDPEPVLTGGGPGTWNEKGVSHASVVEVDGGYRMYFDGHIDDLDTDRDRAIGLATSSDGVHWELHDDPATGGLYAASDPVFTAAFDDGWDGDRVMAPEVLVDGDRYVMIYLSSKRRTDQPGFLQDWGYAVSDDGITWRRGDTNPVLGNRGAIAFITNISAAAVDGIVRVYYDIAGNAAASSNAIAMRTAALEDL